MGVLGGQRDSERTWGGQERGCGAAGRGLEELGGGLEGVRGIWGGIRESGRGFRGNWGGFGGVERGAWGCEEGIWGYWEGGLGRTGGTGGEREGFAVAEQLRRDLGRVWMDLGVALRTIWGQLRSISEGTIQRRTTLGGATSGGISGHAGPFLALPPQRCSASRGGLFWGGGLCGAHPSPRGAAAAPVPAASAPSAARSPSRRRSSTRCRAAAGSPGGT